MFKFIKQYADKIEGVAIYPIMAQIIFIGFFIVMLVYVFKMSNAEIDQIKKLPLE